MEEELDEFSKDGILAAWEIPEYEQHDRSTRWYVITGIIFVALITSALLTANFVFAIILVMGGILMFLNASKEPRMVPFMIFTSGILIGDRFHPFHEFQAFSILYRPPQVKRLYLTTDHRISPVIHVPLGDEDPNVVRESLLMFLPEDLTHTEETLTELFSRVYKL